MEDMRKLQRGAFDLISVAIGLTMLAITVVGTSSAMLVSRQALVNQEHYKVATYVLRGEMEKEIARFQLSQRYRDNPANLLSWSRRPDPDVLQLDNPFDRRGEAVITNLTITRDPVRKFDREQTAEHYYQLAMHANWTDAVAAGSYGGLRFRDTEGPQREIVMATTFAIRD